MGYPKNRKFRINANRYLLLLGKITVNVSELDFQTNIAIAHLCLSAEIDNMFIILSEINSLSTKIKFAKNLSNKVLPPKINKKLNKLLEEAEQFNVARNKYVHSAWRFFSDVHAPVLGHHPRGKSDIKSISVTLDELRKLSRTSERCAKKFRDLNVGTIWPTTSEVFSSHSRVRNNPRNPRRRTTG